MRLGIKGKQVLGVTTIVALIVAALSLMHLAELARVKLDESRSRAELLANAIYHRAREVVASGNDPAPALAADPGLRSILESSLYSPNVTFAALVDVNGRAVAHADPTLEGQPLRAAPTLDSLLASSSLTQLREIYAEQGRNFEYRQPLYLLGDAEFGSIRIGVSTLLIRRELNAWLRPAAATALIALAASVFGAMLLAQLLLRPIHVIRSGLTRLGQGEFGVRLDLNQQDEFGELGTFFNTVSAQLSADRSQMAGQVANLESAVERLEDAVAIVNQNGEFLFANPAMRAILPGAAAGTALSALVPEGHPLGRLAAETLLNRESRGPVSADAAGRAGRTADRDAPGERLGRQSGRDHADRPQHRVPEPDGIDHPVLAKAGRPGTPVRRRGARGQEPAQCHDDSPRAAAAAVRLALAGEWKARGSGRQQRSDCGRAWRRRATDAIQHVDVIAAEIRRLDEVVQGFLKFTQA